MSKVHDALEIEERRKIVGEFLREKRLASGLTQRQVAKHLKYSTPQFVSNWERGMALPPMDALPRLCKIFSIQPDEMINTIIRYQEAQIELQRIALARLFKRNS